MGRKQGKTRDHIAEAKELAQLYLREGLPVEQVAEEMGWSVRTTYFRLKFHGLAGGAEPPVYCDHCGHVT